MAISKSRSKLKSKSKPKARSKLKLRSAPKSKPETTPDGEPPPLPKKYQYKYKYTYDKFEMADRQIRLLDLLPGPGPIRARMRHAALSEIYEKYECLSYSWGAPSAGVPKKIFVDGMPVSVRPNLYAALLRLRSQGKTDYPRTLWVDALCINQDDFDERNTQVRLMGEIYSSCRQVVIWLGEHDPLTESAFNAVEFMASRADAGEKFNYYDWRQVQRGRQAMFPKNRLEALESGAAFTSLFSRPWFTRVWVIQELALSPHAIVVCGKYQINWDRIAKAHSVTNSNFEVQNHVGTILRYRDWPRGMARDIFSHMIMAWHNDASDHHDKIYGFMGLQSLRDKRGEIWNEEVKIDIDYKKHNNDVFPSFTRAYLEQTRNLQVLAICRGCKVTDLGKHDSYPSWAIDHEYDRNTEPLPYELISWGYTGWKAHPKGLRAGGSTPCTPSFDGANLLSLQGFEFDTVAHVSAVNASAPAQEAETSTSGGLTSWVRPFAFYLTGGLSSWKSAIRFCQFYIEARQLCQDAAASSDGTYHPTGQTVLEAFWQVIRGRERPVGRGADEEDARARRQLEGVDALLTRQGGRADTVGAVASITRGIVANPSYIEFFSLIGLTKQRRFFVTSRGFMGLGPRETRPGDRVVLLQGHGAPVVARHPAAGASKHGRIVGDSYVLGIMEGEAFDESKCELLWFE